MGIKWYDEISNWYVARIDRTRIGWRDIPWAFGFLVFEFFVAPFVARISATLVTVLRHPAVALQSIVRNWARATASIDTFFAPEVVPEHPSNNFHALRGGLLLRNSALPPVVRRVKKAVLPVFLTLLFFPALLYRWSLKATSIIYAPLVFVAHSTFSEGKDLRTKLELIRRGDLSRIRVLYGLAAIAVFLVKLVLMAKWNGFAAWWNGNPITEFLAVYVAPTEIPIWQVAELANSALAIGSMLFARHALLRYNVGHPFPDTPVKRILGFVSGLRMVLALYTIVCLFYLTMRAAQHWHWPAFGEKWFPWQRSG